MAKQNNVIKQIKKATRRKFSADEKIRIVLEGLRGEISISELSRREGIAASVYYKWSKDFLEAGKNGLTRDTLKHYTVLVQRESDKSISQLRDFSCLRQILNPPLAGLFLSGFLRHHKAPNYQKNS
jgi:transposase